MAYAFSSMKIIVGLGNPGTKYIFTRHNLGFMLIDALAEEASFQKKYNSLIQKVQINEQKAILVKPQTFMNLSGQAIKEIMNFYKIELENLLVIHDDKDQVFGKMKFQKTRGDGGHKGIKNIHKELQTNNYTRLKLGIGPDYQKQEDKDKSPSTNTPLKQNLHTQPSSFLKQEQDENENSVREGSTNKLYKSTVDYVLSPFNQKETEKLPEFLEQALKAVHCFIQKGYEQAANQFNS